MLTRPAGQPGRILGCPRHFQVEISTGRVTNSNPAQLLFLILPLNFNETFSKFIFSMSIFEKKHSFWIPKSCNYEFLRHNYHRENIRNTGKTQGKHREFDFTWSVATMLDESLNSSAWWSIPHKNPNEDEHWANGNGWTFVHSPFLLRYCTRA